MRNPQPPPGLVEAFRAYERALADGDAVALERLTAPGPTTLHGDAGTLLVGSDAIRLGRRAAAPRRLVQTHVQTIDDDHALVVAVTEAPDGTRGLQTQLWARDDVSRWQVTAMHVSTDGPEPAR